MIIISVKGTVHKITSLYICRDHTRLIVTAQGLSGICVDQKSQRVFLYHLDSRIQNKPFNELVISPENRTLIQQGFSIVMDCLRVGSSLLPFILRKECSSCLLSVLMEFANHNSSHNIVWNLNNLDHQNAHSINFLAQLGTLVHVPYQANPWVFTSGMTKESIS